MDSIQAQIAAIAGTADARTSGVNTGVTMGAMFVAIMAEGVCCECAKDLVLGWYSGLMHAQLQAQAHQQHCNEGGHES